jgi:hypothetical protein
MWATCRCHILDSEISSKFPVDLVSAAMRAFNDPNVPSMVGELSLCLQVSFLVVNDSRVFMETMIYIQLIRFPARLQ